MRTNHIFFKRIRLGVLMLLMLPMLFTDSLRCLAMEGDLNYLYSVDGVVEAPPATEIIQEIGGVGDTEYAFFKSEDLFATEEYLYVADTGNHRILKLDKSFQIRKEYRSYRFDGKASSFSSPSGVFVDSEKNLLIADRDNKRVVKLKDNGDTITVYGTPQSALLPENFNYLPSKVTCDQAGRIFVAVAGFNMGLIELDKNGEFVQLLGASKVTYSVAEAFWRLISTKAQQQRMASFVPAEYNNITIDEDGFIFVTTGTMSDLSKESLKLVRKLNAKGEDVLPRTNQPPIGDQMWTAVSSLKGPSKIVDCVNLKDGNYAILDSNRGRIFAYDRFGTLLFEFSGLGQTEGTMTSPSSLTYFDDHFVVLDMVKNKISVFGLTEYGRLILDACSYRNQNDYDAEQQAWTRVYELNNNHPAIMTEMGKISYRKRDMKQAMYFFKEAGDQKLYSRAYRFYRRELIYKYFNVFGILVIAAVLFGNAFYLVRKRKRKLQPAEKRPAGPIAYARHVIFRPIDGFWDLKREKRGSMKVAIAIMLLAGIIKIFDSLATGFIFNPVNLKHYNFLWDLLAVYAPVLLWIICNWAVTTLMDGEGSFRDIVTATGYALTPFVVLIPTVALFSNLLTTEEGVLCSFFISVTYVWMFVLLVASVMETHNYSLGKTILVIIIIVLVIVLLLFLFMLGIALIQQMAAFVIDIKNEIVTRF